MMVLSLITCKVNNKRYVGVTKKGNLNPINPFRYGHGSIFVRAVKKYGKENFDITIIASDFKTREELHIAERKAIKEFNTLHPNGYNIRDSAIGTSFSKNHGDLIKKAQARPEVKIKMIIANRDISRRPSVKAKVGLAAKLNWANPEYKIKTGLAIKKILNRPDIKEKQREAIRKAITLWWAKRKTHESEISNIRYQ